jgi:hypothetical protein
MILGSFDPLPRPFPLVDAPSDDREFKEPRAADQWKKAEDWRVRDGSNWDARCQIRDDSTAYAVTELDSPTERAVSLSRAATTPSRCGSTDRRSSRTSATTGGSGTPTTSAAP